MTRYVLAIFLAIFLLSGICWAQQESGVSGEQTGKTANTGVSNEKSGKLTDSDGNTAEYIPNQNGGGQIEYKYIENTIWNTTYINISKAQEKEILAKAKKGEKIPDKLVPTAIYHFNKGLLLGNGIDNPLDNGDNYITEWRVMVALGRVLEKAKDEIKKEGKATRKTIVSESDKTRNTVKKTSSATQIVVREDGQETRDLLENKLKDLPGIIFFVGCVIIGAIVFFQILNRR